MEHFVFKPCPPKKKSFEVKNVKVELHGKIILDNIDFSLFDGECVGVFGPSGAGKTTFLKLFNRLVVPSQGTCLFEDKDISGISCPPLRRKISLLFQEPVLATETIRAALLLPFQFESAKDSSGPELVIFPDDSQLMPVLASAGFPSAILDQRCDTLSGGEKQRVALARLLLMKPKILLLDEPTSALDHAAKKELIEGIKKFLSDVSIVVVSHDPELLLSTDRIIQIKEGKIFLMPDFPSRETLLEILGENN